MTSPRKIQIADMYGSPRPVDGAIEDAFQVVVEFTTEPSDLTLAEQQTLAERWNAEGSHLEVLNRPGLGQLLRLTCPVAKLRDRVAYLDGLLITLPQTAQALEAAHLERRTAWNAAIDEMLQFLHQRPQTR